MLLLILHRVALYWSHLSPSGPISKIFVRGFFEVTGPSGETLNAAVACCAGFTRQSIDLVSVARSDIAGDLGAFFHIAVDHDIGGGCADAVSLLKAAIAAIEARDHLLVAGSARRFGVNERLRLGPPFLAFAAVADAAQEMQRPQNFR